MVAILHDNPRFKRAVSISLVAHLILFFLLIFSPNFPKFGRRRTIHYVNLISLGGGGGGGSPSGGGTVKTEEELGETPIPQQGSLRDLTTPEKLEQQAASSLRYPVEKPKAEPRPPAKKKAVIKKQENQEKKPSARSTSGARAEAGGTGEGLRLGMGSGSGGGGGFGSGFSSQIGLSSFPYTYYLENLQARISSNWIKSRIPSGGSQELVTTVYFKIYRDGQISLVEIEERSGIDVLDQAAVRAVQSAAPFAPLPEGYEEEYLGIHLIFEHGK